MSYVPKYVLKRLIPADAVKLEKNVLKVKVVNILMPLPLSEIPGNFLDILEVKLDGEIVLNRTKPELFSKASIIHNDQTYPLKDIKNINGGVMPVGDIFYIVFPNFRNFKVGDTHKIEFNINIASGVSIEFERTIC
jgi:hypothetical protein